MSILNRTPGRPLTAGIAVLSVLACQAASADIDIALPSDTGAPLYFSGTNCRVHFHVEVVAPTHGITNVKLIIGGMTTINEDFPVGGGPHPVYRASVDRAVMFDSTEFESGSTITVRVEATDTDDETSVEEIEVSVNNGCTLYGLNSFESQSGGAGSNIWAGIVPGLGYNLIAHENGSGWSANDLLADFGPATVFYVGTHGTSSYILDSYLDPIYAVDDPPHQSDPNFFSTRKDWVGLLAYGPPPFNSSAKPMINLAYFDCCLTGADTLFEEGTLWMYLNYYSYLEDQAEFGYKIEIPAAGIIEDLAQTFLDSMADGDTCEEARQLVEESIVANGWETLFTPDYSEGDLVAFGDPFTRIKGVYTQSTTKATNGWWRLES